MKWDEWIGEHPIPPTSNITHSQGPELDNQYLRFHADKTRRIEERGEKCCRTAPEAMDGAVELLEELYAPTNPTHFLP